MPKSFSYPSILFFVIILFFCSSNFAFGQSDRIGEFIRAGAEDAEILTRAYLKPLPNGIGANLNTGWFNSASTHKTLGFDIQVRGALAFIPSSDQDFNLNELDLQKVELVAGESPISPTAGGDDSKGSEVVIRDNDDEVARFNLPQGSGFNFVPAPMIQASVGLIKNTDVTVRFVPEVSIRDYGDFNQKGFGIKHSLTQWLPAGKLFPVDISIFAGYNRIDIDANLNLNPEEDAITDPTVNYDNQKAKTTFDTFSAKVIVGKDLPFISVYGGVGYETSTMNLDVTGNYPVPVSGPAGAKRTETLTDPFSYSEDGVNNFSLTGGLKFKLLFFNIFGEYTLAKYPVANAGIGFSFR